MVQRGGKQPSRTVPPLAAMSLLTCLPSNLPSQRFRSAPPRGVVVWSHTWPPPPPRQTMSGAAGVDVPRILTFSRSDAASDDRQGRRPAEADYCARALGTRGHPGETPGRGLVRLTRIFLRCKHARRQQRWHATARLYGSKDRIAPLRVRNNKVWALVRAAPLQSWKLAVPPPIPRFFCARGRICVS